MSPARRAAAFAKASAPKAAAKFSEEAPIFAALGEPTRITLVARLCSEGPLSIARLSDGAGVTRQAITKHLNTLEEAGVVRGVWSGRERIWEIETKRLEKARRCLERISTQWDVALERLRSFVEHEP
jgi:DNA-binding transcriptional ArsR family regulator